MKCEENGDILVQESMARYRVVREHVAENIAFNQETYLQLCHH